MYPILCILSALFFTSEMLRGYRASIDSLYFCCVRDFEEFESFHLTRWGMDDLRLVMEEVFEVKPDRQYKRRLRKLALRDEGEKQGSISESGS